jgi:predicted phosphodiesterase
MILGIYADLHSNLPALRSMEMAAGDVDRWVSLGDTVGLFPAVNDVLDWQRERDALYVRGDHEEALSGTGEIRGSFSGSQSIRSQQLSISADNRAIVERLPETVELEADGHRLLFSHFLTAEARTPEGKYRFDVESLDARYGEYDFVFYGHTHLPAINHGRNTIFLNPGSAGFPVDVDRRCSALVFDTATCSHSLVRFDYDRDELIGQINSAAYNPSLSAFVQNDHRWG